MDLSFGLVRAAAASGFCLHCGSVHAAGRECWIERGARRSDGVRVGRC